MSILGGIGYGAPAGYVDDSPLLAALKQQPLPQIPQQGGILGGMFDSDPGASTATGFGGMGYGPLSGNQKIGLILSSLSDAANAFSGVSSNNASRQGQQFAQQNQQASFRDAQAQIQAAFAKGDMQTVRQIAIGHPEIAASLKAAMEIGRPETVAYGDGQTVFSKDPMTGALTQQLKIPEKATPNAAFNPDGTPNLPYQKYQKDLKALEQAPAWAGLSEKKREYDASNPMLGGNNVSGPDALASAPQATQAMVKAMIEGRQAPPTSFALSKPYWQNMIALANAADPTFDQTTWGARASARKDMLGGGKSYQTLNAGNTAIQHLGHLNGQIDSVSGVALPLIGDTINAGINKFNAPQGNLNPYNDTLGHLAEETTKFYRGTGGNEADITRNMANLSPDLSTQAKRNGVANTVSLIYGKLAPMVEQYNKTMNTNYPASHFLSKRATATIKQMGYDPDTGEKISAPSSSNGGWVVKKR